MGHRTTGAKFVAQLSDLESGNHSYYFLCESNGEILRYPENGELSLNILKSVKDWENRS